MKPLSRFHPGPFHRALVTRATGIRTSHLSPMWNRQRIAVALILAGSILALVCAFCLFSPQ